MRGDALPLFDAWPRLRDRVATVALGEWPTPVDAAPTLAASLGAPAESAWIKRDDLSSPIYGGNKVRTLEVLFGDALAQGARAIYSTGAFGSNHALAAALHAPRVELEPGAILFPQPRSACALENAEATLGAIAPEHLVATRHWSTLPLAMARVALRHRRSGCRSVTMVPGGATPHGGLGYVNAALELAHQVAAGDLPAPNRIVVGVGSTCTTAGLLVGTALAARRGIGFATPPKIVAVRVTPWPVTSRARIARLAAATAAHLADLVGDASLRLRWRDLFARLEVDGRELGKGYGRRTKSGRTAILRFADDAGFRLDTTYSAKSGAAFLRIVRDRPGPSLFWSTKSTAPLPARDPSALERAPRGLARWLASIDRTAWAEGA